MQWSSIGSDLAGPIGGAVGDLVDQFGGDKVSGVPTPGHPTGADQGTQYSEYMDKAFPGTTPWERLGPNSPAGATESSHVAADNQFNMQKQELANRRDVADMNNRASIISASSPMGALARESNLAAYAHSSGAPYDTKTAQEREELPSRISKTSAEASETGARAVSAKADAANAPAMAKAKLISERNRNVGSTLVNALPSVKDIWGSAVDTGKEFGTWLSNSGPRPRRFNK